MDRYKDSQIKGNRAEDLFLCSYYNQILRKASKQENMYSHIDFVLKSGQTVDVKSKTKIKDGYVCIEVVGITGHIGWCHPLSKVDLIAFQLEDNSFKIVLKDDLLNLIDCTIPSLIQRQDRIQPKEALKKWVGRKTGKYGNNKDVFTYVLLDNILKLKSQL